MMDLQGKVGTNFAIFPESSVTERGEPAEKLIDQRLGNAKRQVQGEFSLQPSRLQELHVAERCYE